MVVVVKLVDTASVNPHLLDTIVAGLLAVELNFGITSHTLVVINSRSHGRTPFHAS